MDRMVGREVAPVRIGARLVGPGQPCFIIAEAGVNHNGSLDLALKLIDAAVEAGADAVKFQTFRADRLVTKDAPKADYQKVGTPSSESQFDMLRALELSEDAHRALKARSEARGILFLSTPFDRQSADLLSALGVSAYKLPSGEITNLPLLSHVAAKGKPIILSTGMASLPEVNDAVGTLRAAGCDDMILLHCVSNYPASPADVNLRAMATMRDAFGLPVGYSDHTPGDEVSLAAVALGACVIEKHFTLDRNLPGPDHKASLEPHELEALVGRLRNVEASLGDGRKEPAPAEAATAAVARKSLVAARPIPAGTPISLDMLDAKRPGTGIPPSRSGEVAGRTAKVDIAEDAVLDWGMLF